ncbi:MAG: DUF5060 domain-containing protein [Candidatus Omnitrophota bacterium]
MKRTLFFTIFFLLGAFFISSSSHAELIKISSKPSKADQYEPLVFKLSLPYFSGDPYDSDQVRLDAKITSPSGKLITVPAFCLQNNMESKESVWEVRFTPLEEGKYRCFMELKSRTTREESSSFSFDVKKGEKDGFLRRSRNNDHYLRFDSGKPFFGIGHNVAWVNNNSISLFDRYFAELGKNGCNLTRVWICDWSFPIEWKKLGQYDQNASGKLDELFRLAEKRNIYIMLCLDTYGSLMDEGGQWAENRWKINPYNAKNGGPCENPEDLFTDPEAKRAYKNKLRYIISRWGYSPNVMAFEIWNEYNAPPDWVKEMASYIRSANPHEQLVTTSLGYPYGQNFDESGIWRLDEIDLATIHVHSNAVKEEMVPSLVRRAEELTDRYGKPCVISEFGIDNTRDDSYYDPKGEGTALHNSIWSTALSRYCATAMNWWWDNYIRPKGLYYHYKGLNAFLHDVDWDSKTVKLARTSPVRIKLPRGKKKAYHDKTIKPVDKWSKIFFNEFEVLRNGDMLGSGEPNKYLHGKAREDYKADLIFYVDYPVDSKFIAHVDMVSQGGHLVAYLDEEKVLEKDFPTGEGKGPWERCMFRKDHGIWQCVYNTDVKINVPRGRHVIRLTNTGKDWIGIKSITLKDYVDSSIANARCLGLIVGKDMLLWVQNKDFNWRNTFDAAEPKTIKKAYFEADVLKDGQYLIEQWDTFKGKVISTEKTRSEKGVLHIELPDFSRDIALRIKEIS